jgi:hypothetical protein
VFYSLPAKPSVIVGKFEVDLTSTIIRMCEKTREFFELPIQISHDVCIPTSEIIKDEKLLHTLREETLEVYLTKIPSNSVIFSQVADTGWYTFTLTKSPTVLGCLCTYVGLPVTQMYNGWSSQLDLKNECLVISPTKSFNRTDLSVLHMLLHNYPRKVIARHFNVSVKAIEKRLAKCKLILSPQGCSCYSLNACLKENNLSEFIMAQFDWFNPEPSHNKFISPKLSKCA